MPKNISLCLLRNPISRARLRKLSTPPYIKTFASQLVVNLKKIKKQLATTNSVLLSLSPV